MNVLEKAEKAIEYLKNNETSAKSHELQAAAGTLGRCLGALGSRSNYSRHYANLLHSAIPTLLALASNDSAEVRLVGDEALNRAVVGGFAFHGYKTNITLQNQIDHTKNARWIRAALSRICLGESWLRPGVGKIRSQAQTLIPKLSQIVRNSEQIQLIVETLDTNLPRILNALAEYTTDEEITELSKALLKHVDSPEAAVRRGAASCLALLCVHRDVLITPIMGKVFEKLWPRSTDSNVVLGWFGVIKSIFQANDITSFAENDLLTVQDYLELYHLCISYIEQSTFEHNIQNAVMECLSILLSQATGECKKALLEKHPRAINLDCRVNIKGHSRNISSTSAITSVLSNRSDLFSQDSHDVSELIFSGALHLGSLSQLPTPRLSVEDLTIQTPDSPTSVTDIELDSEQLTKDLSEKLQEYEVNSTRESENDVVEQGCHDSGFKVNIGSSFDDDIPLKYCARLLISKFILTGNKGGLISDRSMRVSVKSSALNCLSEILQLYPQAITMYVDKEADLKNHNISGSSEGTDSNQDNINDFILERNVCYQDSLTDSLTQDLLNKSMDSQTSHQQLLKKHTKPLEKSMDSVEQKSSSKDVQSNIFDSKIYAKNDLMASGISADSSNFNMTNSNFTSNSNMTGSFEPSCYPMSSSGEILTSSIDLDMKFDHFGDSNSNLELERQKRPLRRTDDVIEVDEPMNLDEVDSKEFVCQHMSEVFLLLCDHNDPQIRGLVRVCVGSYLNAALDLSHGDFYRWKNYSTLPKDVSGNISTEKLVDIVLKGLSDTIHSSVNYTLTALTKIAVALVTSAHYKLLTSILNGLVQVENNKYWLCKINLCKLYDKLPYQRLFILLPGFGSRSKMIMDSLYRLLADQDQRVRNAAANTIALITSKIYQSKLQTPTSTVLEIAVQQSRQFTFEPTTLSLHLVRNMHFYHDLPEQLKVERKDVNEGSLKMVVSELMSKLMQSSCKFYSQGLTEALYALTKAYPPWNHIEAYSSQGILEYCLDNLDCCNGTVAVRTVMIDLCTALYPVSIHNIMRHRTTNRDIFERDNVAATKWHHLDDEPLARLSEKFQTIVLRMLNIVVHLIEEVNPVTQMNKGTFPGSPVRKNTDSMPRKSSITESTEEKSTLRKKPQMVIGNLRANFAGNFYGEPFYLKFYDNLRATYSNHKINLDPKSSMFYEFLTSVLNALAIQLELSTEKEFGYVTEELLYYLKTIMPLQADKSVYCVTQLLKCLFGTNMVNQYNDFMSIAPKKVTKTGNLSFFDDVLLVNKLSSIEEDTDSRRNSISSNSSQKMSIEMKNPKLLLERQLLVKLDSFIKNKTDRKWSANKKELERYIRLFEPVVIQSLKSYTMQNDVPLQCKVLCLLNQLLTLRVNYCMLDSDQIFIGFLFKQLDLIEQHEIPNSIDLVSNIMLFLVHLSASKHHSKQIIELPKLIQLCDGLLASGAQPECISALERVSCFAFSAQSAVLNQQHAIAREVLQAMHGKCMHTRSTIDLVSCVLALSQESYIQGSTIACDTLLSLLSKRTIEIDDRQAVTSLERLIDYIYKDVLLEQCRVELVLKILFQAPPPQATTPFKHKLRYLSIIMVLLRKVLVLIPESEILLSINYLKSTYISPQSIFFNVKNDIDPLNVQNVNETCANLSPDVILVRLLFKTLTYAILELDGCHEMDCANFDLEDNQHKGQNHRLLYSVCVNLICQVKHMLHLTNGCLFPLTAKTAQNILHNEQSGLNTGLYSPDENIPLELLNLICLRSAHRIPLLTVHWSHLLIRLKFLEQKYWQNLLGFVRNLPLSSDLGDRLKQQHDTLQIGCFMAYCEYFIENGLTEVVHLTWLLVNRIHILISQFSESLVRSLVRRVSETPSASGLLLQAAAARCNQPLKGEFAVNLQAMLSECHSSQSGPLIFLICRIIGKLEPSVAMRFAKLAIQRCRHLKGLPVDDILMQLTKEDVQVALEMLQRDKVYVRYPSLVLELNSLASSVFDLSPLDLSQDRAINPQYIRDTSVDATWLVNLVKNRCCQTACTSLPKVEKKQELALLLSNLSKEDFTTVINCQDFDRKLLSACFKVACDSYIREFVNIIVVHEGKENEKDNLRQQREAIRLKEEMMAVDNKLNNTLHVFKKSDNKESKSQFFIPMSQDSELNKTFGNLQISDEESEIVPPNIPDLYLTSITTFDKSLTEVIRLFPKQNRPLSQSETFNLNIEQTVDRYTRRCHQVFQDKLFHQEFMTMHTVLAGFLASLERILAIFEEIDCDIIEKWKESILPGSLAKNIAGFSVISLQYLSFLIKNKKQVESPVNNDVSFRVKDVSTEKVVIEHVMGSTLENVSKALSFTEIWSELNIEKQDNKTQSAISCLYAIVKYFVKDIKPLTLKSYLTPNDQGPKSDIIVICDKLLTLLQYWEDNFYKRELSLQEILSPGYKKSIEGLIISLSRLDIVSNIALIPPLAWPSIEVSSKKEELHKIDLPLPSLEDMDVLEVFLFRANLIGWSSKKQFSEMWVAFLSALRVGGHWAARGMARLLVDAAASGRHASRTHTANYNHSAYNLQRLRTILVGTSLYNDLFECVNLERIPLIKDRCVEGYHYAQFNADFLKLSSEESTDAPYKVRLLLKRLKKKNQDLDLNSCLQLLVDVASNMLEPKAETGAASRIALLTCLIACGPFLPRGAPCIQASLAPAAARAQGGSTDIPSIHQKLLKTLSSRYAPLRQAALQGCLAELYSRPPQLVRSTPLYQELMGQLRSAVLQCLGRNCGYRISVHEQTLYWTVLFALVEFGHPDLMHLAVDFLIDQPRHYCTDLVVKGITSSIRQQVLPKELKNTIIEKLMDNMKKYSEYHATQIVMVHLFSADDKLLSPKLTSDVSNMDPDVLMNSMDRITLLYKVLRESTHRETKEITTKTLKYFLRETLPPAATLSRVVIEFVESCKVTQKMDAGVLSEREKWVLASVCNAKVVFEVFETAITQDQLLVLSGWIFEALCHLLSGKITNDFLPHCLILLLISASANENIRQISPLTYQILRLGFNCNTKSSFGGVFKEFIERNASKMSFSDRKLLCIVAMHSNFSPPQLERLKELCEKNACLNDLLGCLNAT